MDNKDLLKILSIIILVIAIGLSPRFSVGHLASGRSIDLRAEDFVLLFFGIFWLINIFKSGIRSVAKPPLFLPILAWLGLGLFSLVVNIFFDGLDAQKGFFFFLKGVEYFFLFFYVFYHIKNVDTAKFAIDLWIIIGALHANWIIMELLSGSKITYFYGPTTLIEPGGTSPGGGFLLLIFIFLFNILIYYYLNLPIPIFQKILLSVVIISPVIGVISSGSRGIFAGLVAAMFASLFLAVSRKLFLRFLFLSLLALALVVVVFSFSQSLVLGRLFNVSEVKKNLDPSFEFSRPAIWKQQLNDTLKPTTLLQSAFRFTFGRGKAVALNGIGESHNQYIRNFVETGIIGSMVFLFLLYLIIKESLYIFFKSKDPFLIGVGAGLFSSTVVMMVIALFAESFIVVKTNEPYWFFAALTFALMNIYRSEDKSHNHEKAT